MASVFVDIPGVGNVEAKNAATEATLKEILAVMKGVQKNTGGKGNKGGGDDDGKSPSGGMNSVGKAAYNLGKGFGTLTKTTLTVAGGIVRLGEAATATIEQFSNVGNDLERAAGVFSGIPLVGKMFSAVAGAAQKTADAYTSAAASGATFGGSMAKFSAAATSAGMTMAEFANLIKNNGEAMTSFGTNTDDGAQRFAKVSKELRATAGNLYALGYSTQEINEGLASYGKTLKLQGRQGSQSNAELVAGSKKYLQEMDLLAKVTGESRKDQEKAREKLLMDAQVQAKISSMTKEQGEEFMNTINGLPPGLRDVAKDIMVTGSATTEEAQKFSALMPKSAELMRKYAQITESGGTVTKAMQQELQNTMAMEGKEKKAQLRSTGMYNKEFAGTMGQVNAAAAMNKDALTDAEKAQLKAKEETDKMNERVRKAQEALAGFSNQFQIALVNSGMLDLLMKAFKFTADLVMNYVVPTFNVLAAIISDVGGWLFDNLKPVFETIGNYLRDTVYPAFLTLAGFIIADVVPILESIGGVIRDYVWPALQSILGIVNDYILQPFLSVAGFIWDNLTPILLGLGTALTVYAGLMIVKNIATIAETAAIIAKTVAMIALLGPLALLAIGFAALTSPIGLVVLAVVGLVALFKKMYDSGWDFSTAIEAVKDNLYRVFVIGFKQLMVDIRSFLPQKLGGYSAEEEKLAREKLDAERKELDDREKARDAKREENKKDRDKDTKRAEASAKVDQKITGIKDKYAKNMGAAADKGEKAADKAAQASVDFNAASPDLLKQFAASEGSAYIKDAKGTATANAKAGTGAIVTEAEQKKAAEMAAVKKAEDEKAVKSGGSSTPTTTQESPATLLASLNTKMDQLISVNRRVFEVAENQLSVQKGLTGNLYKSV